MITTMIITNLNCPSGFKQLSGVDIQGGTIEVSPTTGPLRVALPGGVPGQEAELMITGSSSQTVTVEGYDSQFNSFDRPIVGGNQVITPAEDPQLRSYSLQSGPPKAWVTL